MGEKVKKQQALPVTASKKDEQSLFPPMLMSVKEVLMWALVAAGIVAVTVGISAVMVFANIPIPCSQAAAAAVGLLLRRRHAQSRWCLAFLAIVSATIAHYMEARDVIVFIAANPGDIVYDILSGGGSVIFLLQDLRAILSLLVGGAE